MEYNPVCFLHFWLYVAAVNYGQLYDGILDLLLKKILGLLFILTDFYKCSININLSDEFYISDESGKTLCLMYGDDLTTFSFYIVCSFLFLIAKSAIN